MDKKKLVFFEPEVRKGEGHHLDSLIEASLYFGNTCEIIWIINKKFKCKDLYIPQFVKHNSIIESVGNDNFLFRIIKHLKDFFKILKLLPHLIKKKKIKHFINAYIKNFFTIPDYFCSYYLDFLIKNNLDKNDVIIVHSTRPKDAELFHFINNLEIKLPKIIFRFIYPPKKKKLKNFYYFYKNMIKTNKNIKIFTEVDSVKEEIFKFLKVKINNFTHIFSSYNRNFSQDFIIGFLGESRIDKGFNKLPDLIDEVKKIDQKSKFIIHFSKKNYENTNIYRKKILNQSKFYSNIDIRNGYLDFKDYRNVLKKITIMPILYPADHLNFVGSGLFFSCITFEIPMIIPYGSIQLKKFLKYKCYLEASSVKEYAEKIFEIKEKYSYYLAQSKKLNKNYLDSLNEDPLIKEVLI